MTCIVGFIDGKNVYIGGDSAGVDDETFEYSIRADSKVFTLPVCNSKNKYENMILGFTSSFRMGQLLKYKLYLPKNDCEDTMTYMVTYFIDEVRNVLKEGGFNTNKNDVDSGGEFLVGYQGKLYTIFEDYQVGEDLLNYSSVGCGSKFAIGALDILSRMDMKTEDKITKALDSAVLHSAGVKPPYKIISTLAIVDKE